MNAPANRWWVSLLLGFLALGLAFLSIAYLGWLRAGPDGSWYGIGIMMFALNAGATVVAIWATNRDARTGQVSWGWWFSLSVIAVVSVLLYEQLGRWVG